MGAILKDPLFGDQIWQGVKFSLNRSEHNEDLYTCTFHHRSFFQANRYLAILEAEFIVRTTSGLEICRKPKPFSVFGWCFSESAPDPQFLIDKARYIIDSITELEKDHAFIS
ncbi:hypothetical protein AB2B38_011225 [Balneola sp. MJW-20]|uniref:hypothetical protein n=1 Tax=Gracilimonas aurantiaca TaxID=3234185 RepID=UPI003465BD08